MGRPCPASCRVRGWLVLQGVPQLQAGSMGGFLHPLGSLEVSQELPPSQHRSHNAACFGFAKFSEWGLPAPFQGQTCPWVENNANSVSSQPKVELWSIHWEQGYRSGKQSTNPSGSCLVSAIPLPSNPAKTPSPLTQEDNLHPSGAVSNQAMNKPLIKWI